jgi:acetyl esterase/lipase
VRHVIASGVHPKHLRVVGDSAGGNLVTQLLSHILHPVDGVPVLSLPAPIGGIYLMSPWASFSGATTSHAINAKTDVVAPEVLTFCGRKALEGVPESFHVYLEASNAPDVWFKGAEEVVDRILITAGARECMKDDIEILVRKFCINHSGVDFVVQEDGVHNDPYYDFLVGEKKLSKLTPLIINWLAE